MRNTVFLAAALAMLAGWNVAPARAADSAVVVTYNRFGEESSPALNTRLDQLETHIAELKSGGYRVMALPQVVDTVLAGGHLPDKTVALSIDDAAPSVWLVAWPLLKAAQLPFTVFISTDEIDRNAGDRLSWDQLREMAASGLATIGTKGAGHVHMPLLTAQEVAADLARAKDRFGTELGWAPTLFAWPYGEMSREAAGAVRDAGFRAAFGQHSGPLWRHSDPWFLPRFPLNETYGETERFRLAVRSLPLPAVDVTPDDPKLTANPPAFGFTLSPEEPGTELLACYISHEGRAVIERLGPRVEVRMGKPLPPGRSRINCTAPTLEGRWRWFGWQFLVE